MSARCCVAPEAPSGAVDYYASVARRHAVAPSVVMCLDRDVLEGGSVGESGNEPEPGLADPGPDPVDKRELPEGDVNRLLVNELLHFCEDRCAFRLIELVGLLRIQFIDVGIAAVNVRTATDDKGGKPGRRIAESSARSPKNSAAELLSRIGRDEAGALDRLQPGTEP